jgi:hypothetical protein
MHAVDAAAGFLSGTLYPRKLSRPRNTDRALVSGDRRPQADSAARSPHAARLSLTLRVHRAVGEHYVIATKSGDTNPGSCSVGVDRTVRRQDGAARSEEGGASIRNRKRPPGVCLSGPRESCSEECAGRAAAIGLAVDTRTHRATAYEAAGSRNDRVTKMEIRILVSVAFRQRRRHEPCTQHYCERDSDPPAKYACSDWIHKDPIYLV